VVLNLVMNARDAMPNGGRITLRTHAVTGGAAGTGYVLLSVADTGSGIPRDIQQRIFEPFFTTKAAGKGSGLGLSTAYGIVKQSGGSIVVRSTEGEGSVFTVQLPIAEAASAPQAPRAPSAVAPGGTETVLLVEDEVAVRRLAHRTLGARGYQVVEAEDGMAALAVAASHQGTIDILVTDIVMPRMNGLQLVAELRARHPALAVVLMSGYSEEVVEQRGAIPDDCIFLSKPFRAETLAAAVADALAARPRKLAVRP
jgi:two-component system cell cycle sensor histidine kinase/response regulator CckA